MMTLLETKYEAKGRTSLPKETSEHNKINVLAPRPFCLALNNHAHTLRLWRNATQHERGQWAELPSDGEVEEVVQGVMSELAHLDW